MSTKILVIRYDPLCPYCASLFSDVIETEEFKSFLKDRGVTLELIYVAVFPNRSPGYADEEHAMQRRDYLSNGVPDICMDMKQFKRPRTFENICEFVDECLNGQ